MSEKGTVIMSPLLSKRLDNMDIKLDKIIQDYNTINSKFDKIIQMLVKNSEVWEANKDEYIKLLLQNKELSQNNMTFLNENRDIYIEKLNKIQKNNNMINNICDPNATSRINNRYWRTSGNNTVMKPPETAGIGSVLWPWNSIWNSNDSEIKNTSTSKINN
jgi:hypothetical protein